MRHKALVGRVQHKARCAVCRCASFVCCVQGAKPVVGICFALAVHLPPQAAGVQQALPAARAEHCTRGSLRELLRQARSNAALAAALRWQRRLMMALDAAKVNASPIAVQRGCFSL